MVPREKQGGDLIIGSNFLMSHRCPPDLFVTRNLVKLVRLMSSILELIDVYVLNMSFSNIKYNLGTSKLIL